MINDLKPHDPANKLSLIIPVHNAEKIITKTVKNILAQDYVNREIILVENGSDDRTREVLYGIVKSFPDDDIVVIINDVPGTSLARKAGIQVSTGRYIAFSDQDDCYDSPHALSSMVHKISESDSDICQFGFYSQYFFLKKKYTLSAGEVSYSREQLMDGEVAGVTGYSQSDFSPNVWSKIYRADLLKRVAERIDHPLYRCEDMYLNSLAFFDDELRKATVYPDAYYRWKVGTGTSSDSDGDHKLFLEYGFLKPLQARLASENNAGDKVFRTIHTEVIYFMRALIGAMITDNLPKEKIMERIGLYEQMQHVIDAKIWLRGFYGTGCKGNETGPSAKGSDQTIPEMLFLIADHTPEEYYRYVKENYHPGRLHLIKRRSKALIRKLYR